MPSLPASASSSARDSASAAATVPVSRHAFWRAIHLGVSFCGVFMAFSVSQSFQTSSDHKSEGSNALGILYAFFTACNFVASAIVTSLGAKWSLFIGSLTYVSFVAANIHFNEYVLYIFSALLGIGASIIWTAQGVYISGCAAEHERDHALTPTSTLGYFNGIFFSIFQSNQLLGNLLAALLFKNDVSTSTIFGIMTSVGAVGALSLTFLAKNARDATTLDEAIVDREAGTATLKPSSSDVQTHPNTTGVMVSVAADSSLPPSESAPTRLTGWQQIQRVFGSVRLLAYPRMIILLPIMIYSGFSQGYIFGSYPPLIDDKGKKYFMLAMLGATDALGSIFLGKMSDKYGRVSVISIGFGAAASAITFLGFWQVDQDALYIFFIMAFLLGLSDAVFNCMLYAILGTWFEGRTEHAFAILKLFQAGSTAMAFIAHPHMSFNQECIMNMTALIAGILALAAYDLYARAKGHQGSVLDRMMEKDFIADAALRSSTTPMLGAQSNDGYGAQQPVAKPADL